MFKKWPLLANVLSSGLLFGSGDFIAQRFFSDQLQNAPYDYERTARSMIFGSLIAAPVGHKWYQTLSKIDAGSKFRNVSARVALDQAIYAPLIAIPLYFGGMSVLERRTPLVESARQRISHHWLPTYKKNFTVWPIFQTLNFLLVPVPYQLLLVNIFSIGWTCYLSTENAHK